MSADLNPVFQKLCDNFRNVDGNRMPGIEYTPGEETITLCEIDLHVIYRVNRDYGYLDILQVNVAGDICELMDTDIRDQLERILFKKEGIE